MKKDKKRERNDNNDICGKEVDEKYEVNEDISVGKLKEEEENKFKEK